MRWKRAKTAAALCQSGTKSASTGWHDVCKETRKKEFTRGGPPGHVMKTEQRTGPEREIRFTVNKKLFEHWKISAPGAPLPARRDLDLRTLAPILGNMAVLERAKDGAAYRFRLAGTELRKIFGEELTGGDLLLGWRGRDREIASTMLDIAMQDHVPLVMRFGIALSVSHREVVEAVFLPMAEENQMIATFAVEQPPHWLGIQKVTEKWLISVRTTAPAREWQSDASDHSANAALSRHEPIVLVSTEQQMRPFAAWPGFKVIPGGRK